MIGVVSGITMVAAMPRRPAWYATACAWFPALAAMRPRARSSAGIVRSLFRAPRSLYAPVIWRFSSFRCAFVAERRESVSVRAQGERYTRSRMRASAAWTSSSVTMGEGDANRAARPSQERSVLNEPARELHAIAHAELVEDRLEVALHRLGRDPQALGHLARAQPVGDEQRDLAFTLGEPVGGGR